MAKLSKRQKLIREKVDSTRAYSVDEAVALLAELGQNVKFKESVDVAVNLGVDARKSDQVVRSSTVLPHGTGKTVRVAVFTQGANAEKATAAGADVVGMDDLADEVKKGNMDFDVVIATPDAMRVVGQLGQILGPRGLMPNPKVGTVTADVETAVKNAKAGQVRYRTDKNGIIHAPLGNVEFSAQNIKENLEALVADLKKAKPASSKGVYLKKITISSTMGPGLTIDQGTLSI
ncbi:MULTISPECIES: 50S ribosomal protein L1 [Marinobacter]|jgi:large subunit ribosomal protein L1|uniref:Large ribosomal subunit protein uL1 n=3 Tax=Marinobacter TaxID=2742 RepID=RL1_MARN8|nr:MULTISPECIES: 50S ribosomal protein L1 [Marinobacter]A1TYI7.1 RecName: Full=Large ribosomal subunit protein uL1; AltName: Full=50S ribosomal protein L1 [Marinobacter nauticus VT8]ABM17806.1 LSU ribosomal protein L1P [Marinobacter nauticus VT8]ERS83718.1 50S ribosomal protein L1 [Marinobacter sp. C1S70]ERS87118.1 50S ribosomal protein L1 [Marinobacter sp. EVN1]MAC22602.1 50S ribosomal protein L1 [Marinobacter sp.]MBY5938605.1 50S ribosomal protein L1 [Marinobacter nauticus]|tara:strand:- start:62 stop:760 length:699 start_codon:yes stop_codon:yes gene_type:complete